MVTSDSLLALTTSARGNTFGDPRRSASYKSTSLSLPALSTPDNSTVRVNSPRDYLPDSLHSVSSSHPRLSISTLTFRLKTLAKRAETTHLLSPPTIIQQQHRSSSSTSTVSDVHLHASNNDDLASQVQRLQSEVNSLRSLLNSLTDIKTEVDSAAPPETELPAPHRNSQVCYYHNRFGAIMPTSAHLPGTGLPLILTRNNFIISNITNSNIIINSNKPTLPHPCRSLHATPFTAHSR